MLESAIVMTITLILFLTILSFGFLLYEKAVVLNVAESLASDIAATYKYPAQQLGSGELNQSSFESLEKYRMTFSVEKMKQLNRERADSYAEERIKSATLGISEGRGWVEPIVIQSDNIGCMHVEVTVCLEGDFLFSGILEATGILDGPPRLTATARAQCVDITGYAGYINFINYACNKQDGGLADNLARIYLNVRSIYQFLTE